MIFIGIGIGVIIGAVGCGVAVLIYACKRLYG
jgi:hypothetical protein